MDIPHTSDRPEAVRHVSDTALWVAYYRAVETDKANPLFRDPFARKLAGDKGSQIARSMKGTSRYTAWTLVIRTHIIDEILTRLISEGADTVLNLGAGLDTRPYRMRLPSSLKWIEVDYPHLIEYKQSILREEKPVCNLQRISLDLADRGKRQELFKQIAGQSRKTVVLTEGVIPYLTVEQVTELAHDLHAQENFHFWIAEYFSPLVFKFLRNKKRLRQLRNAPFQFNPKDWFGLFRETGWNAKEIRYLGEESRKLKRRIPSPWWTIFFRPLMSDKHRKLTAYVLYERRQAESLTRPT